MNVQEFDTALSDLETRVDRLRALYENWFRGYEKMEPAVARKDVERRVYGLRKELPRNTALRFRYNQLYQRYTTLATYWQRTARQIEEGTYRLQLQRMQRRRVDDDLARTNIPPANRDDDEVTIPPPAYELNLDESLDVNQLLEEADIDQLANSIQRTLPNATPVPTRPAASPPAPTTPVPVNIASARFSRPSVANDNVAPNKVVLPAGAPRPAAELQANAKLPPAAPGTGTMKMPPAAPGTGTMKMPLPGAKPVIPPAAPVAAKPPAPPPAATAKPPLKIPVPNAPPTGTMPGLPSPRVSVKPPAPGTGAMPMPPPPARDGKGSSPGTGAMPLPPRPGAAAPASATPSRPAATTTSGTVPAARPGSSPATTPRPAATSGTVPSVAGRTTGTVPAVTVEPKSAANGARPASNEPKSSPGVRSEPGASASVPPARPSLGPRAPAPSTPRAPAVSTSTPRVPASGDALSEQRMRRIYDEYTAARRKNNEGEVRYEALASTIQKMLPDLSKKHQGKQIDFEIVLKDGRVGLKPKAT